MKKTLNVVGINLKKVNKKAETPTYINGVEFYQISIALNKKNANADDNDTVIFKSRPYATSTRFADRYQRDLLESFDAINLSEILATKPEVDVEIERQNNQQIATSITTENGSVIYANHISLTHNTTHFLTPYEPDLEL